MQRLPSPDRRALPPGRGALAFLLLLGVGCQGGVQGDPGASGDYVPPVLLSAPEDPPPDVLDEAGAGILDSIHHLRTELRRFADTVSTDARSYPAARCCPRVLRDLLVQGHRWDAGAAGAKGPVVPILEQLVREPTLRRAPRLVELVLDRVTPSPQDVSLSAPGETPVPGGEGAPPS